MMLERTDLILRLTQVLASLDSQDPLPTRLCQAFVQVADGGMGSIALGFAASERTLLCATSDTAARYEDAQDLTREGPSLEAFRTGQVVSTRTPDDLRRRWPALADVVSSFALPQVHAIPMRPGHDVHDVMGVLTVHHQQDVDISRSEPELRFLSDAVGAAIIGDLPSNDDESRLWTERDQISQATGMVVAQLLLEPRDALAVLRAHAFAHETSLRHVARRVIARELDFRASRSPADESSPGDGDRGEDRS